MAFLALASQKSLLTLQKNFLQFEQIQIQNDQLQASSQMSAIQQAYSGLDGDASYDEDPYYIYYEQLDEQLGSKKDSLDSQLTAIENEISSLKTLVNNNIKTSCTLNLVQS